MTYSNFYEAVELLKNIFVEAKKTVVQDISTLFGVVDEEPITFTLILQIKKLIKEREAALRNAVASDIVRYLNNNGIYRTTRAVQPYVNRWLIIDVIGHKRLFESRVSASDYGLVVELPQLYRKSGHVTVRATFNGLLLQAKRNAVNHRHPERYRRLAKSTFDFSVRRFLSLSLYNFVVDNDRLLLSDILFVPLNKLDGDNAEFVRKTNDILLLKNTEVGHMGIEWFANRFLKGKLGTKNNAEIENYIRQEKLPFFEIKIYFADGGKELRSLTRTQISPKKEILLRRRK